MNPLMTTPAGKVLPPALPAVWVGRPRLRSRLDEARRRRLTVVVAGAGFGKSSLLAEWVGGVPGSEAGPSGSPPVNHGPGGLRSGFRAAWYSLRPEDRSLPTFLRGLVDALWPRVPGLPLDVSTVLDGSLGPQSDDLVRADGFAAVLGELLERELTSDLFLVLDDVHELAWGSPSARLVEGLCRHAPASFHLVLASRAEPPFMIERLRGGGQVLELDAGLLALTAEETSELLATALGDGPGGGGPGGGGGTAALAATLYRVTGGWPAAVCLAAEVLRHQDPAERPASLAALRRPGGRLFAYLAEEAFAREDPAVRELVRRVAPLSHFTATLCRVLGLEVDEAALAGLARRGVFLQPRASPDGWFMLNQLVREFAMESMPLSEDELRALHQRAAAWLSANGNLEEALTSLLALADLGEPAALAAFIQDHGRAMLVGGAVARIADAAARVPPALRSSAVEQVEGQARQVQGDWQGALECFRRAAGDDETLPASLAWRMGLIYHQRGELDTALRVYRRGTLEGADSADEARLLAWTATAHWLRGEQDACQEAAERSLAAARASGDQQALATAHTTMALLAAIQGDRAANDAHYLRALEAAERANDVLQLVRIHTNRGSRSSEEGMHQEALAELETAIRLGELTGFAAMLGTALNNRGEAWLGLGRLDEAIADFSTARGVFQRMGSRMMAYPLAGLGDVYRERGDLALARAAYEEAIALGEQSGDQQGLVPALAGLARILVRDEPDRARRLAERALVSGTGMGYAAALLAAGWVALATGEREQASRRAAEAAEVASARRDQEALAEALELRALAAADPRRQLDRLREAAAIWATIGNPLAQARNALAVARLEGAAAAPGVAGQAEQLLLALGVKLQATAGAGLLQAVAGSAPAAVRVQALGGFRVLRDGEPVGADRWRSQKARDLLKLLVARRGRPAPRELLMETLWPDEDPARLSNRLSVALSTVRAVLDPERRFSQDRFVAADRNAVWLADLLVDVEEFLAAASAGLASHARGEADQALALLTSAEMTYAGDFLEEDRYEDWAVPLREEARAAYLAVTRTLARIAATAHDHDLAVRYHLRLLERDPYDEEAHIGLVVALARAGRHGEARRRYRLYTGQMAEIGVESAPFPSTSADRPAGFSLL
jgi:ATP/maltotriose-dependent transcriptional regulator MalT/DNA-binding SARP family transcriptional activator